MILCKICLHGPPCKLSPSSVATQRQTQTTEAVSMETVSYVVGVDVCVVPLQSIIQDGDDHSFSCDAFLPHRDHVQVEFRQRGRRPRVLLEDKESSKSHIQSRVCVNHLWALHPNRLCKYYHVPEKCQTEWSFPDYCADLYKNSVLGGQIFFCQSTLSATYGQIAAKGW